MNSDDEFIDFNRSDASNNPSVSNNSKTSNNSDNSTAVLQSESDLSSNALFDGTYYKLLLDKCTDKNTVAVCMKCSDQQRKEVKGYGKTTSNFLGHLKRKHGADTVQECKKYLKDNKQKNNTIQALRQTPKTSITQENFDRNLVNYFVNSMIAFRAVEDPYFIKMMKDLNVTNSGIKIPGRRSLRKKIAQQSFDQICEIKERLAAVKYLCTTADIWSGKKRSFLGVTVHWIDNDYKRRSAALACRRFKGVHTFNRIKDILLEIFSDFDIEPTKIVCSVTDNGSNFVKAFKIFGVNKISLIQYDGDNESSTSSGSEDELNKVEREETEEKFGSKQGHEHDDFLLEKNIIYDNPQNSSLPFHFRCNAHTLNLIASKDVQVLLTDKSTCLGKMHSTVMEKCNDLWGAAARPKSAEVIHNILGHTLTRPGITRWNSYYDALKTILKIKSSYSRLARALGIRNPLRDSEFQYIEEYCQCAAPVAAALDILQGDDSFYGILLPCLHALKKKLQKITTTQNLKYCEPLAAKYLLSTEKRFEEFYTLSSETSKHAAVAALCYPRFKKKWLVCLTAAEQKKCINFLKSVMRKEMSEIPEPVTVNNAAYNTRHQEDEFFDFNSDSSSEAEPIDAKQRADLIISNFFAEGSQEQELLQSYPVIGKAFVKYNTPMPSSGPVERMFSFATMLNKPRSHKLSDDLFEKRVVMKCNLNIKKLEM